MTNKWRVEGKEVFKSMHKNIHLNEIFNCLLQAFGRFQTDAREPVKETQFDNMVACHGIFAAIASLLFFVNFLFLLMISRPTSEIPKEFFSVVHLFYHLFQRLFKLKLCLLFPRRRYDSFES